MSYSNTEALAKEIVDCAYQVHRALGPGLLESAYQQCLFHELKERGLNVEKELPMPLVYKDVHLDCGYRIDLMINRKVLIEIKAVDALAPIHLAQTITYLKLSELSLGFLINFNVTKIKDGIKRVVYNYDEEA